MSKDNNIVIGIISYFPEEEPLRTNRINRFERLLDKLKQLFKDIPITVVAQNWKNYKPKYKLDVRQYEKLGILKARKTLRENFLSSEFNNIITLDDDCIISGDSGEEYLKQVLDNPNGMGVLRWEYSQLNLLYISRHIYEKVELPDIDPEKSEGFEDTVFVNNCKQLFPDKVFTFNNTGINEVGFRNADDGATSTWANQPRDWKKLRGNTNRIKEGLNEGKTLAELLYGNTDENIDVVITYVDSTDKEWQKDFKKYSPQQIGEETNSELRFRRNENLRYIFRGIEKHTPWISKVHLVVSSESQVPAWVNKDEVNVVTHKMIIPEKHLPSFNSQTIEMFLSEIPGLGGKFLYLNDDMYFTGDLTPEDFFDGDKVKVNFSTGTHTKETETPLWKLAIQNSQELVDVDRYNSMKENNKYIFPPHNIRPYIKKHFTNAFKEYNKEILESLTKFRGKNNFTIYLFDFYQLKHGAVTEGDKFSKYFSSQSKVGLVLNAFVNPETIKTICINDTSENLDIERETLITKHFDLKFPDKSKYEK